MISREHKRSSGGASSLHDKLQLLRSITNSHAMSKASIIVEASKYIKELKEKVERLNQDIEIAETSSQPSSFPVVTVDTLEKGFLINILSEKSCPGLLVLILETFEELGLNVVEARVSCGDTFRLQAVGGENEEQGQVVIDSQVIKQAVVQAIENWRENNNDDDKE